MSNSHKAIIVTIVILVIFLIVVFVKQSQKTKLDLTALADDKTFYATIEKIRKADDGYIHLSVQGLKTNNNTYNGKYNFTIKDTTIMTFNGETIDSSDLSVGDNIIVTFDDEMIIDIYPTPLQNVTKIELVDDE